MLSKDLQQKIVDTVLNVVKAEEERQKKNMSEIMRLLRSQWYLQLPRSASKLR